MSIVLSGISSFCGPNPGGLLKIEYVPVDWVDVTVWEEILLNYSQKPTVGLLQGDWLTAYVLPNSRSFTENQQSADQGEYFEINVAGVVPYHTPALAQELQVMKHTCFIIKMTDRTGQVWLVGDPEYPLRFTSRFVTGSGIDSFRSHEITWNGLSPHKKYGYAPDSEW